MNLQETKNSLIQQINEWNSSRLELFSLSFPDDKLEFHGVMRFFYQGEGHKFQTKCLRVSSRTTTRELVHTLIEKFHPDMKMLTMDKFGLYEHNPNGERRLTDNEHPLLVQLNWSKNDREGKFILRNETKQSDKKLSSEAGSFKRKWSSKREKLKRKNSFDLGGLSKSSNGEINGCCSPSVNSSPGKLPDSNFTRTISNPEEVMKRKRQQKLQQKLHQISTKVGEKGGTLKIYGDTLNPDIPYKTLLLSTSDTASYVVKETLEKYGMENEDPESFCLVKRRLRKLGDKEKEVDEWVLADSDCPLAILINMSSDQGRYIFQIQRRPPHLIRKRHTSNANNSSHKSSSSTGLSSIGSKLNSRQRGNHVPELQWPYLVELELNGGEKRSPAVYRLPIHRGEVRLGSNPTGGQPVRLPTVSELAPTHCSISMTPSSSIVIRPVSSGLPLFVNDRVVTSPVLLHSGATIRLGKATHLRFIDPLADQKFQPPSTPVPHLSKSDTCPSISSALNNTNSFNSRRLNSQNSSYNNNHRKHDTSNIKNDQFYSRQTSSSSTNSSGFLSKSNSIERPNQQYSPSPPKSQSFSQMPHHNSFNHRKSSSLNPPNYELAARFTDVRVTNNLSHEYLHQQPLFGSNSFSQECNSSSPLFSSNIDRDQFISFPSRDDVPATRLHLPPRPTWNPHKDPVNALPSETNGAQFWKVDRMVGETFGGEIAPDMLPAHVAYQEENLGVLLDLLFSNNNYSQMKFKLSPACAMYLILRACIKDSDATKMPLIERDHRLQSLLNVIADSIHETVYCNRSNTHAQAFWMSNSSELVHLIKRDCQMGSFEWCNSGCDQLADAVQWCFQSLLASFTDDLSAATAAFLNRSDCDAHEDTRLDDEVLSCRPVGPRQVSDVVRTLSTCMSLLRQYRVNAALSIQLFSQLLHFLNMWLFNRLVTEPHEGFISKEWGRRLLRRLDRVRSWANRNGLELVADCHLQRISQACELMIADKSVVESLYNVSVDLIRLNSVQIRVLLENYVPDIHEPAIPDQWIDFVVSGASQVADRICEDEGIEIRLEEEEDLSLPLLLPEDGYAVDLPLAGLPSGLVDFLQPAVKQGYVKITANKTQPAAQWTVYMKDLNDDLCSASSNSSIVCGVSQFPVPAPDSAFDSGSLYSTSAPGGQSSRAGFLPSSVSNDVYESESDQEDYPTRIIRVHKINNSLGLSIMAARVGVSELGIYIKAVVPGGASDLTNELAVGDQIISADNVRLSGLSQEEAARVLGGTDSVITLEIDPGAAQRRHLLPYILQHNPPRSKSVTEIPDDSFTSSADTKILPRRPGSSGPSQRTQLLGPVQCQSGPRIAVSSPISQQTRSQPDIRQHFQSPYSSISESVAFSHLSDHESNRKPESRRSQPSLTDYPDNNDVFAYSASHHRNVDTVYNGANVLQNQSLRSSSLNSQHQDVIFQVGSLPQSLTYAERERCQLEETERALKNELRRLEAKSRVQGLTPREKERFERLSAEVNFSRHDYLYPRSDLELSNGRLYEDVSVQERHLPNGSIRTNVRRHQYSEQQNFRTRDNNYELQGDVVRREDIAMQFERCKLQSSTYQEVRSQMKPPNRDGCWLDEANNDYESNRRTELTIRSASAKELSQYEVEEPPDNYQMTSERCKTLPNGNNSTNRTDNALDFVPVSSVLPRSKSMGVGPPQTAPKPRSRTPSLSNKDLRSQSNSNSHDQPTEPNKRSNCRNNSKSESNCLMIGTEEYYCQSAPLPKEKKIMQPPLPVKQNKNSVDLSTSNGVENLPFREKLRLFSSSGELNCSSDKDKISNNINRRPLESSVVN